MWYDVGSKQEPKGKTGFAHLFEHLMFGGSENVAGNFDAPLTEAGSSQTNGSTWYRPHQLCRDGADRARWSAHCSWNPTGWASCWAR